MFDTTDKLIGKTIKEARIVGHSRECDSKNVLELSMTDGSVVKVVGGYGRYTGKSCDEYIETIYFHVLPPPEAAEIKK